MESNVKNNSFIDGLNLRKDWRYRRGNQKPYIEGQTIQWPKVKGQRDKQWLTKHYSKLKIEQQEPT